jgi:hypothetical protein
VNRLLDRLEQVFVAEVKARPGRGPAAARQVVALTFLLSPAGSAADEPGGGKEHP